MLPYQLFQSETISSPLSDLLRPYFQRNTSAHDQLSPSLLPPSTMAWDQPRDTHHGIRLPPIQGPPYNPMNLGSYASRNTPQTAVYRNNEAGNNVHQHNGPFVNGIAVTAHCQWGNVKPYYGNIKHDNGLQTNGLYNDLRRWSGAEISQVPTAPGEWAGNIHTGTANGYGESKQICGTFIIN